MKFDFGIMFGKIKKYFGNFGYIYLKEKISDYTLYGIGDYLKEYISKEVTREFNKIYKAVDKCETKTEFLKYVQSMEEKINDNYSDKIDEILKELDDKI